MEIEKLIADIEIDHGHIVDPTSTIYVKVPLLVENPGDKSIDHLALIDGYVPVEEPLRFSTSFPSKYLPSDHGDYVKLETSGLLLPRNVADMNDFEYTTEHSEIITLTYP